MKMHSILSHDVSENPKFKSREDFLSFLKSIENDSNDDAPVLRNFIARLYYHHHMPSFNTLDLHCACQRSFSVLSEDDISKYLLKLLDIEFLLYTDDLPTKVLEVEVLALVGKKPGSYYLNVDFYKKDRFAAHAGENKEGEPSTGQNWTHNQKGYDVKIISINRTGSVAVEEVATGQRDGFSRATFLDAFTPKSKEGDV